MRVSELSVGILSYYIGTEQIYALLLNQNGSIERFSLLSCEDAFPLIDHLMDVLEQPYAWTPLHQNEVIKDFSQRWGKLLLPPPNALQLFDILVIIPHHFLHGIPLHLVCCSDKPLALSHGISYCSSSTLFYRSVNRNLSRLFNLSDWTFPCNDDEDYPHGPEISSCLYYGVDVLTGKDAAYRKLAETFANQFPDKAIANSRDDIKIAVNFYHHDGKKTAITNPDAICIVCHGYQNAKNPEMSGLLLAGPSGITTYRNIRVHGTTMLRVKDLPFTEIPLHLSVNKTYKKQNKLYQHEAEMFAMSELKVFCETDAQLIALFGCSTGTGTVASNDDYASLAYQWLKLGAASVVANIWEADFSFISDWAKFFAANWVQHRQPKAIAAREATCALLRNRPEIVDNMILWGSVTVIGDWL